MLMSLSYQKNFSTENIFPSQNKVLAAANLLGKQQGLSVPNWVTKNNLQQVAFIENNNT